MDILSIDCTTCGSRLKVRDSNLIGQIIACPKCGSMVEVTPPEQPDLGVNEQRIAVGPEGAVDSQAITRDSISGEGVSDFAGKEPPTHPSMIEGPVFQSSGVEPAASSASVGSGGDASRLDAAAFAQSDRSRRTRQIGLITALSTLGLITSLVAFGFFVRWWQSTPAPPVAQLADETDDASLTPESETPASETPGTEPPGTESAGTESAGTEPADPNRIDTPSPDTPSPDTPSPDGPPQVTPPQDPPLQVTDRDPSATDPSADSSPPTAEDIAASMLGDPILTPEDTAQDAVPDTPAPTEMPPAMQRWMRVLDFNEPVEEPDLPPPPTIEQVDLDLPTMVDDGAVPAVTDIDVERGLNRLMAFDKRPAPLIRWLHLLSQLTGVPIGVDLVALDAAGIDPLTPVTPPGGWLTAGEVLEDITAQAKCQVNKSETMILVDVSTQQILDALKPALQVDDLLTDIADDADKAALITTFLRLTQSPNVRLDEDLRLEVEGPVATQWQATLISDALRLARGLPTRLPRQRTARWLVSDSNCDWPLIADGKAIAAIAQPLPAIDLLVRISKANGAFPYFNWADSLGHGLSPTSESMPWLKDATAGEAIADILEPHQLQARNAGDDRWWIGSEATYDRSEVIAIANIDPSQAAVIVPRLAASVGVDVQQLTAVVDQHSPYLILRGPRFIVRQLPKILSPQLAKR